MTTARKWLCEGLAGFLVVVACGVAGCAEQGKREVEVEVSRVAVDPNSHSPVVLLEDKAHTAVLPIWIGPGEAQAIAMRLEGVVAPRPLTHDLIKNVLDRVGVELRKVVIRELRDNTYYAQLVLVQGGEEIAIDSRPSDAIALAMRFGQPIFVAAAVMEQGQTINRQEAGGPQTATLGGVTVQGLSRELADHFALPPGQGVLVSNVAGEAAGALQRGDIILEVDGATVRDVEDFRRKLGSAGPSKKLSVQRGDDRILVAFEARLH